MGSNTLKSIGILVIALFQFGYSYSQQVSRIRFIHLGEENTDYRLSPQMSLIGDSTSTNDEYDFKAPVMFEMNAQELNEIFISLLEQDMKSELIKDSIIDIRKADFHLGSIFPVYIIAKSVNDVELSHICIESKEEYMMLLKAFEKSVSNSKIQDFIKYEEKLMK